MKEELAADAVTTVAPDVASETTAFSGSSFYCAAVAATMDVVVTDAAVSVEITAVLLSCYFCSAAVAAVDAAPVANGQVKIQPPSWGLIFYGAVILRQILSYPFFPFCRFSPVPFLFSPVFFSYIPHLFHKKHFRQLLFFLS